MNLGTSVVVHLLHELVAVPLVLGSVVWEAHDDSLAVAPGLPGSLRVVGCCR